ncbi:hypothetical protein MASR2M29_19040 [Spirochaetota bacterium]
MQKKIRVLVAISASDTIKSIEDKLDSQQYTLNFAENLQEVENLMSVSDLILTDTDFAFGSLADWLPLWPIPAILLVDHEYSVASLAKNIVDESSTFIPKDSQGQWLVYLPILIKKILAIRESIDRQNYNIVRAESTYMDVLRNIPDIVYVLDSDGFFIYLNEAVGKLGWKPAELIGKHFAEIVHPDEISDVSRNIVLLRYEGIETGHESAPKLFDERRTGERMTKGLEIRLKHKLEQHWANTKLDSWGEISSLGVNLPEFQGRGIGTIGIIHDISERLLEEQCIQRELESRNLIIKEIHHRIKNNLQIVSSLLSLESSAVLDDKAQAVFRECQSHIQSMSLVHEQIYRTGDLSGVEAPAYFERLTDYLADFHDASIKGIKLNTHIENMVLSLDSAISLAIITTELVGNSFKHAFKENLQGSIDISLQKLEENYIYTVKDNGNSQQIAKKPCTIQGNAKSIGMELISALSEQLKGKMEQDYENGTKTRIVFPA